MKIFTAVTLILLVLAAGSLPAQQDFTFHLPNYSYHELDNGFRLILVENHTNPLVASVVVIRTGLRNETPETNGVSHMLEHMTFNGTDSRTQKELYDELDFYGIYLNAQTSEDYTTFMALNHKDQADSCLDIMSDMLFRSNFPQAKFEKEKGIIAEEIRKDSENPDFKKELALRQAFYQKPPYSMPVIGTAETVQNMTRQQVVDYYHNYYRPNNMIAMVIGDFDQQEMLDKFAKYFGSAARQPVPQRTIQLNRQFPFVYSEENGKDQDVFVKLPGPTFQSDEFIPFQFLYSYVLDSQNGELIRELKKTDSLKIRRIQPAYEFHPEFGVLTLKVTTEKGVPPADVSSAVTAQFRNLRDMSIPLQTFRAIQQQQAINEILQTEKIMYYGFLKAQELAVGGVAAFEKIIPAFLQLKPEQVTALAAEYPASWKQPAALYQAGNWTQETSAGKYRREKQTRAGSRSRIYRRVLDNGLTVLQLHNADNPVLAMHFLFKNRSAWEPAGKTGIADFLHHSLFKASRNYSRETLDLELKKIGAEIKAYDWDFIPYDNYYNVPQYSYIRFVTLDQFFDTAMKIAADNVLYPALDSAFSDAKKQMSGLAARQVQNASQTAAHRYDGLLFGESHPLSRRVSGTPETIAAIQPADLQDFHRKYFSANNTILTVVSSLDSATVFGTISRYFADMPAAAEVPEIPAIPLTETGRADSMKIGSRQAYIYLGYTFDAAGDDGMALEVMNDMLSGQVAFSLREQKGWAYRLGTGISSWKDRDYFTAHIGTGRQTTHPAIGGILDEIRKFKSASIEKRSVERTQNSIVASLVRRRASRENQAYFLGLNEFYGKPADAFFTTFDRIRAVTPQEVTAVRDKYLRTDPHVLFYTIPGEAPENGPEMPVMPPNMGH